MDLLSLLNEKRTSYQCSTGSDAGKNRRRSGKRNCRLPTKGIIKGYKALINWEKVDHHKTTALIELKVQPKKKAALMKLQKNYAVQ